MAEAAATRAGHIGWIDLTVPDAAGIGLDCVIEDPAETVAAFFRARQ
jgi:hypothetical protein